MRHLVKGKKLGMKPAHRKATLQSLCVALIKEHRIVTTLAKAKELQRIVEPIITRGKVDTTHNRRQAFSQLQDKYAVTELFEEVGPKASDRPGGYTRVLKIGARSGDHTEMAVIELVDFNDVKPDVKKSGRKRTRRGSSGSGGSDDNQSKKSASKKSEPAVAESEPVSDQSVAEAEESTQEAEAQVSDESVETADDSQKDSSEFTVAEVKEQIDDMSPEEAKEFIGDDERVTVQKALDKKLEQASDSEESATEEESKDTTEDK